MGATVITFNATATPFTLMLNGGTKKYTAAAAVVGFHWIPTPSIPVPPFNGTTPVQDQFGFGTNNCVVTNQTSNQSTSIEITIPTSVNPAAQLILYFFYRDSNHLTWVLLSNGSAVQTGPDPKNWSGAS